MTNEALATMITIDFAVLVVLMVLCAFVSVKIVLQYLSDADAESKRWRDALIDARARKEKAKP